MKWIFAFLLAVLIFGGAALFSYKIFIRPELVMRAERKSTATPVPTPDISLPEFEAARKLKTDGQLTEARAALTAFIQKYPSGLHAGKAQDLLGEVNVSILLSDYPSQEKEEYTVRSGDVLARVAAKTKSTPELIMRTNNLSGTMLRIGQKLLISHPEFSVLIQRNTKFLYLLNRDLFFKRYHLLEEKLPANPPPKIITRVSEIMAWKNGKRIGIGSPSFLNSTRWIRLATPGYVIYSKPDDSHQILDIPPPEQGLGMSASDVEELSSLVNTRTAVTITQ
ncbi:MAG: LysM peptidoglycan-binding domain-containing protein [Chthoniobacterales bacterium]|nr:LysM peptidoglycan-binding domain-containing protein [Chthoniobacterales bacterium]